MKAYELINKLSDLLKENGGGDVEVMLVDDNTGDIYYLWDIFYETKESMKDLPEDKGILIYNS